MNNPEAKDVTAKVQYLANDMDLALYIAPAAGGKVVPHEGNYVMQAVRIHDGRHSGRNYELDREGFIFINSPSTVKDYFDDDVITSVYYQELKDMVVTATGASRVEIFDHTRRATSDSVRKEKMVREPASIIHNDYTAKSGVRRLEDYLKDHPGQAEDLVDRPFAVVNVWRSIAGTVESHPLAMCDADSVAPDDLVPVTRQAKDRIGEIQLAVHNDAHRWTYFPDMEEDEVILFKTFDSNEDGRARFTIHTAFDDPNSAADARVRESIEVRCFIFWD
jgi:hypothetical protein